MPTGVPILTEAGQVIRDYLAAEQTYGRIPASADTDVLGLTLIGSTQLLFADRTGVRPTADQVRAFVGSVVPA
ncbi:hypothetical protein JOF29_003870 [Kribbella aluminosa]|uniref:TetR family transcriptional regulator n=1 Tax=Kribbella aluminosa TaxID=416017 RepID=A0ABS4UMB2_9ACTN|nr:hypothetical protein [Kribbella aluminosa]MBP2352787.1 hypothetical protein [Kribbella aluminosa]